VLALPVACVSWTVTHEEVFREPREWLERHSRTRVRWWQRQFCYGWICEFCLSHYVAASFLALTGFKLLLPDWRGNGLSEEAARVVLGRASEASSVVSAARLDLNGRRFLRRM
jgi:hypothetical protein